MNEEEIPAITYKKLTDKQYQKSSSDSYSKPKILRLCIKDVTDFDKITTEDGQHFRLNTLHFKPIYIRGTIVGIEAKINGNKYWMILTVDDGTGQMDCFLENNDFLMEYKRESGEPYNLVEKNSRRNVISGGILAMQHAINKRLKLLVYYKDWKHGDRVLIIGRLSEFNQKRRCFVTAIKRDTAGIDGLIKHLEQFLKRN